MTNQANNIKAERQQQRNQRRTFLFEKFQKERTLRVLYYMQIRYCSKNKNSRNEKELIRIKTRREQPKSTLYLKLKSATFL